VYFRTKAFLAGRAELQRRECTVLHGAISLVFFGILILVLLKPFGERVRRASSPVRLRPFAALLSEPLPDRAVTAHLADKQIATEGTNELQAKLKPELFGGAHGKDHREQERLTAD
jgi:hypothetical protein